MEGRDVSVEMPSRKISTVECAACPCVLHVECLRVLVYAPGTVKSTLSFYTLHTLFSCHMNCEMGLISAWRYWAV